MHPVTHFLAGWTLASAARLKPRDCAVVSCLGLAPDLDGLGAIADWTGEFVGLAPAGYYELYHHSLAHGIAAALVFTALAAALGTDRLRAALWTFASVHLHFACDLAGSRGSNPIDIWTIPYLAPFSDALTLEWSGQWPLTSWQNTSITLALIAAVLASAGIRGFSPVGMVSRAADAALVAVLRTRWAQLGARLLRR